MAGQLFAWRQGRILGPPGGETDAEVATRITHALLRHAASDAGGLRLVVAHGDLLRGLLAANGLPHQEIPPLGGLWLTLLPGCGLVIGGATALIIRQRSRWSPSLGTTVGWSEALKTPGGSKMARAVRVLMTPQAVNPVMRCHTALCGPAFSQVTSEHGAKGCVQMPQPELPPGGGLR
jgi:Histidine phosphatase superfamily (branch 1)